MVRSKYFLFMFLSSAIVGCEVEQPAPPYEPKEMYWLVRWSYTPNNNLTSSYSINTWGGDDIFTTQATYNFETMLDGPAQTPNPVIDYNPETDFFESATDFIDQYLANYTITMDLKRSLNISVLIGTNNIDPASDTTILGITLSRTQIGSTYYPAISFVFVTRIKALRRFISDAERWAKVDQVLLHELGHSRGLNAVDDDWDHWYHIGTNFNVCNMRIDLYKPSSPFYFCDLHRKILRECLKFIEIDYNPSHTCAQIP